MLDDLMESAGRSFTARWRGYDRAQVDSAFEVADQEMALVCLDRDAALSTAQDLTRQLESLRSEIAVYRLMHAGYPGGSPVAGCLRYLIQMAKLAARSIEAEARGQAEVMVRTAREMAARRAALLDETEQECQRRLADAASRAEQVVAAAELDSAPSGVAAKRPKHRSGQGPDVRIDLPVQRGAETGAGRHALRVDSALTLNGSV
jgi:cell division septum initiation protein DivIVA